MSSSRMSLVKNGFDLSGVEATSQSVFYLEMEGKRGACMCSVSLIHSEHVCMCMSVCDVTCVIFNSVSTLHRVPTGP